VTIWRERARSGPRENQGMRGMNEGVPPGIGIYPGMTRMTRGRTRETLGKVRVSTPFL
jgi:hypothetical protein